MRSFSLFARRGPSRLALLALAVLLIVPSGALLGASEARAASVGGFNIASFTNVTYRSSVDRFPLSYDEWLPTGYNSSHPAPLVVFLHGIGNSTAPVRGGISNFLAVLHAPSLDAATERSLLFNASANHFIFIALNTRSAAGLYANTACGGPQLQDVLDAIIHEKALRAISAVYLIGFSMGSMGALEVAGHFPGLIRGIAVAAPATDLYQEYDYLTSTGGTTGGFDGLADLMNNDTCQVAPSPTNTTVDASLYSYLSVARFAPQNFSNVSVWVSSGGLDSAIPNDAHFWPYLQVNDSVRVGSCNVVKALGEPRACSSSWVSFHTAHPGQLLFRDLYERTAPHSVSQLDPSDIFAFFAGSVATGFYHSSFPPRTIVAGP